MKNLLARKLWRRPGQQDMQPQRPGSDDDDEVDEEDKKDEDPDFVLDNLEEKLTRVHPQMWALGCGILALPMLSWATRVPISCVEHTEQQRLAPATCVGLHGDADALRLPDFCWKPCFQEHKFPMQCLLAIGLFLQSMVVVLTRGNCANWLKVVWYFDVYNWLEKAKAQDLTQKLLVGGEGSTRASAFMNLPSIIQRGVAHALGKAEHQAMNRLSKELTRRDARSLVSAQWASWFAMACILTSVASLCLVILTTFSRSPVSFTCEGGVNVEQLPFHKQAMLTTLCSCVILLLIVFALQRTKEWTIQVEVKDIGALALRAQFRDVTLDGKVSYFYNSAVEPCTQEFIALQLHELHRVSYEGILYRPAQVLGNVPQKDKSKTVGLHFKTLSRQHLLDNVHRKRALYLMLLTALLLYLAGTSCWTCIRGIHASSGTSVIELEGYLMLMGACGRHASVGASCKLACLFVLVAIIQQAVIFYGTPCGDQKMTRDQLMFFTFADFRKTYVSNASLYQDVDAPMPEFSCHVWVVGDPDEGERGERVTNCTRDKGLRHSTRTTPRQASSKEECNRSRLANIERQAPATSAKVLASAEENVPMNRENWRRSTRPKMVRLIHEPIEIRSAWIKGLMRPREYNPPSICIEFDLLDSKVKQIVPPEFVAGHFHAALNLGPKVAWEKISSSLLFFASVLAIYDFSVFFLMSGQEGRLTRCTDIINRPNCAYLHLREHEPQSIFLFRHSIGPYAAIAASVAGLIGMVELRVAYVNPDLPSSCGVLCLWEYCAGLTFGLSLPFRLVMAIWHSVVACICNAYFTRCVDFNRGGYIPYMPDGEVMVDTPGYETQLTKYSLLDASNDDEWTEEREKHVVPTPP